MVDIKGVVSLSSLSEQQKKYIYLKYKFNTLITVYKKN